jgi:small subunit ribosomal protein S6
MHEYEILLMLDPDLADEKQSEVVERTKALVEKGEGTWERHDVWGRRKLSYEIRHKEDGAYHLLWFKAGSDTLEEIERVLKIDDSVMRHMATRRPERGPSEPVAVGAPAREDGADTFDTSLEED